MSTTPPKVGIDELVRLERLSGWDLVPYKVTAPLLPLKWELIMGGKIYKFDDILKASWREEKIPAKLF